MKTPILLVAVALALGLAALPPATAHGATSPAAGFDRLLHDLNDDCGSEGLNDCRNGYDVIALDIQEKSDASLGNVVVVRVLLDKADASPADVTVSLGSKSFTLSSSDDTTFTGTGVDRVEKARSVSDGTRFQVDAVLKLDRLGKVGETLKPFKVEAKVGGNVGDFMPGRCNNSLGACTTGGSTETQFERTAGYTLRGPVYYLDVTPPADASVGATQEKLTQLTVKNAVTGPQQVTISASSGSGAKVEFHEGAQSAATQYKATTTFALAKGATANIHVRIQGITAGASETVTITLTTDLGGKETTTFKVNVGQAGANPPPSPPPSSGDSSSSPAPAAPIIGAAMLALASRRARRQA